MTIASSDSGTTALDRLAPLAGVLFAALTAAGDLTIDEFPDGSTPADQLPGYYAAHGAHVALGGTLLGLAALCFAVFCAGLWTRVRTGRAPAVLPAVIGLGAALETMDQLYSGAVYHLLGRIGTDPHVTPGALQAWHISGSEFGWSGGMTLVLLGAAVSGIAYRALPRWLVWPALVLAVAEFTPVSFLASLAIVLWVAVAGIALAARRGVPAPRTVVAGAPVG